MDINQKLIGILLDLHGNKRSGVLRIQNGSTKKQLVLQNGRLAFAESNLPQEHLARVMVSLNLLPRAKLNEIASSMKTGKTSEEAILALSGLGTQEIGKGRTEQAVEILSSLLVWREGEFHFYPGDSLLRHQLNLGMELPHLVAVCVRHAVSKRLLQAPSHFFSEVLSRTNDFAAKASLLPLNETERRTCSLLEKPMNAAEVIPLIPAGEAKPEDALLCLFFLGMIKSTNAREEAAGDGPDATAQMLEETLHRFESASLYEILSIPSTASQEEIQAAYHQHAKQLHPDRFQSTNFSEEIRDIAERVFAHINEAYLTLRNPDTRAEYEEKQRGAKGKKSEAKAGGESPEATAEALFCEGRSLLARGDTATAVERLKGSVWLCPQKASYHYYLGVAESEIPRLRKDAEQHLLRAIELEDVSAQSHLALAKLYIKVNLPRKAELQVRQALLWDQNNAEALQLAAALKKLL